LCEDERADRIIKLFKKYGLRTNVSQLGIRPTAEEILNLMYQDKKVSSGNLVLILAEDIGKSKIVNDIDPDKLKEFLRNIISR
jgi:3-dehydroquinate synthetase